MRRICLSTVSRGPFWSMPVVEARILQPTAQTLEAVDVTLAAQDPGGIGAVAPDRDFGGVCTEQSGHQSPARVYSASDRRSDRLGVDRGGAPAGEDALLRVSRRLVAGHSRLLRR